MEIGRLLAQREVSAVELQDDFLGRCERTNSRLNAIMAIEPETARVVAQECDTRARLEKN